MRHSGTPQVSWAAPGVERAGTVHLGGTRAEVLAVERDVARGRHADRPFVLAAQPSVVDDSRAPRGHAALWSYAHVPHGSTVDVADQVEAQIERFAPGFRDLVLARSVRTAAELGRYNPNYVGGDILCGATTPWQMMARPALRLDPYGTPLPGVYLCSAATPPGPGVQGLCGLYAARRVLRRELGIGGDPLRFVATAGAPSPQADGGVTAVDDHGRRTLVRRESPADREAGNGARRPHSDPRP